MTSFDPNIYATLAASNPAAAQQYLASVSAPAPQAQPQPQGQYFPNQQAQAQQAPAPVLARGTVEDFFNQPQVASGGASVTKFFNGRPVGSWLRFRVTRDLTANDVRQQTDINNIPQTFRDGTPKWVLIIPVKVLEGSDPGWQQVFENGDATLWVKGLLQEELNRAIAASGTQPDANGNYIARGNSEIVMASAGEKPSRKAGYSPSKLHNLQYQPPVGGAVDPTPSVLSATPDPAAVPAPLSAPSLSVAQVPAAATPTPIPAVAVQAGSSVVAPTDARTAELLARLNPAGYAG